MKQIKIYFDGGCQPNPGSKYCSYEVVIDGLSVIRKERVDLGYGTNNEAEFEALIEALKDLKAHAAAGALKASACSVETDSKIVVKRLTNGNRLHTKPAWREASERMFNLANRVLDFEPMFSSFSVRWKGRESNVERFGH